MIIDHDRPSLNQEIERFLCESDIQTENIPVTIIVNPPVETVIENPGLLSEVLVELLAAYRTEGNYFLKLHKSPTGLVVTFGIEHGATSVTLQAGHC